jgi:hypothetical protein
MRIRFATLAAVLLAAAATTASDAARAGSLRFYGHGVTAPDEDRVKIRIDDPALPADPGPPVDVGASDFTIEFWLRAAAADNTAASVACGFNIDWIYGNILIDRDRYDQDRKFGVSLAGGEVVFGVSGDGTGDATLCSTSQVLDDAWHHVALQRRRSDGRLWLYVDGTLEAELDGPDGDVSYPDDGMPGNYCGGPCTNSDPFVVLGAEKHDAGAQFPSYAGLLDELRFSDSLRYSGSAFAVPAAAFAPDADTVGLYHFDAAPGPCSGVVPDSAAGSPTDGDCRFGGAAPAGPVYTADSPFAAVPVPAGSIFARIALAGLLVLAPAIRFAAPGPGRRSDRGCRGPLRGAPRSPPRTRRERSPSRSRRAPRPQPRRRDLRARCPRVGRCRGAHPRRPGIHVGRSRAAPLPRLQDPRMGGGRQRGAARDDLPRRRRRLSPVSRRYSPPTMPASAGGTRVSRPRR